MVSTRLQASRRKGLGPMNSNGKSEGGTKCVGNTKTESNLTGSDSVGGTGTRDDQLQGLG